MELKRGAKLKKFLISVFYTYKQELTLHLDFVVWFGVLFMRKHAQKRSGSYLTYCNDCRKHVLYMTKEKNESPRNPIEDLLRCLRLLFLHY